MRIKKILLTAIGFLFLGIGAVGLVVPVLPTTPFVIIASACFSANPKMQAWLYKNRFFAEHIINYKERTGLKRSTVVISLTFLWLVLCISMVVTDKWWLISLLAAIGIAVTIHILCIANPKKQKSSDYKTNAEN